MGLSVLNRETRLIDLKTLFLRQLESGQTLNYTEVTKFDYNPATVGDKIGYMKYLFQEGLQRKEEL